MDEYRIRHELAKILASKSFRSRKQICNFLSYIVEETLKGREKYLKQYTIAVHGLAKSADFSPEENPLVRVEAGRLRKLLSEYYNTEGRDSVLRISLPKGSYQPVFLDNQMLAETAERRSGDAFKSTMPVRVYSDWLRVFLGFRCFSPSPENLELYYLMAKDFTSILKKFPFVKVLSASPNSPSTLSSHAYLQHIWKNYQADFLLKMDMEVLAGKLNLKCLLIHSVTEEIVWVYNFDISNVEHSDDLKAVYKKVSNDLFLLSNGAAHQYWGRYMQEHNVSDNQRALLYLQSAFSGVSRQDLQTAFEFCQQRLDKHPYDTSVIMVYLYLCIHELFVGHGLVDDLPLRFTERARAACHLFPDNAEAHLFFAVACFLQGDDALCREEIDQALYLNAYSSLNYFWASILYYALNDTSKADQCIQQATSMSQRRPDWYHIGCFLRAYAMSDYEPALQEAKSIHVSWGVILRAIAHKKLQQDGPLQRELNGLKNLDIPLLQGSVQAQPLLRALQTNPWLAELLEEARSLYALK